MLPAYLRTLHIQLLYSTYFSVFTFCFVRLCLRHPLHLMVDAMFIMLAAQQQKGNIRQSNGAQTIMHRNLVKAFVQIGIATSYSTVVAAAAVAHSFVPLILLIAAKQIDQLAIVCLVPMPAPLVSVTQSVCCWI